MTLRDVLLQTRRQHVTSGMLYFRHVTLGRTEEQYLQIIKLARDVPMGDLRGVAPSTIFKFKKVGQKSAMLQESRPQYFLRPFFSNHSWSIGQNVPTQQKVPRYITEASMIIFYL